MIRKVVKKNSRNKAFIGAIIGSVAGIAGGLINAGKQKKADAAQAKLEAEAFKKTQEEQYRLEGIQQASAMTSSYANQDYVDQYQDKVSLKNGGSMKIKKSNSADRIEQAKKFKAGGRKKAEGGAKMDVGAEAGDAIGGIGSLVTSLFTKPKAPKPINILKKGDMFNAGVVKTELTKNSYQVDVNGNPINTINPTITPSIVPPVNPNAVINPAYGDRLQQAKLGKRIKAVAKSNAKY